VAAFGSSFVDTSKLPLTSLMHAKLILHLYREYRTIEAYDRRQHCHSHSRRSARGAIQWPRADTGMAAIELGESATITKLRFGTEYVPLSPSSILTLLTLTSLRVRTMTRRLLQRQHWYQLRPNSNSKCSTTARAQVAEVWVHVRVVDARGRRL
jgi:hypothetical protein